MNSVPSLGLVINTWNQADYLGRVLKAVAAQTSLPQEVLLADDGSQDSTADVFKRFTESSAIPCIHVRQEHQGFRRSRILNQAIARATSQYLVFLDGDTVPHPQFISDHRQLACANAFVQGHRALLKQRASAWFGSGAFNTERRRALWSGQMQGLKHAYRWPRPLKRRRFDLRGVRGCNLAIWREHLLQVNGYNEAFVGWGREDSELAVRLINCGIHRLDVRGWAVCFHLWHPPASRTSLSSNDALLADAQAGKLTRCDAGVDQYLHRVAQ
ncbi:MAG TPA: glycosyltransferase [Verrucomicrobiae bacterium]|jgi:glycosyltransferase involved in cell wall biosynthesis|nr:glycosyltransferase [Verrucomicrobiae bacterium]